jgi:ADP-ribose pyrophosphatase YjhB (NUDIX family)
MVCNLHKEVLLVRSVFGTGEWELPGGGAGYKESYTAAAARELAEEAAVFVSPAQLKKTTQLQLPYPMIIFSYTLQNSGKQAKIRHPFEIKALGWFSIDNLPAETALYVREIIRGRPDNTDGLMP